MLVLIVTGPPVPACSADLNLATPEYSPPGSTESDTASRYRLSSQTVSIVPQNPLTLLIIAAYLAAAIFVGYIARRHADTSSKFLHARGSLPTGISALAFFAANCGALEIVGIVATSAKYGVLALDFYWIGAIPAMVALSLLMMPVYLRSGAMTVPDFIRLRYNDATHLLACILLSVMMVLISGISLYAISMVLHLFFGWSFSAVAIIAASVVLCYAFAGGLKATIYNEIFQLALTIAGIAPMTCAIYRSFHGVRGIMLQLPQAKTHLWANLPWMQPKTATMDAFGAVLGLGFVLSFGYWCTDFILIQRALAAKTFEGAIRTPLLAAIPKLVFPWLIVFPGMAAATLLAKSAHPRFDYALPILMQHYYGWALTGLGVSAILASLMSGLAANVTAFSTLWTHDLYRTHFRPRESDAHYLRMGRNFTAVAAGLGVATAYFVLLYNNLMDYLQLVFAMFNAPLFAVFLLGMFTTWATPAAGFWGLVLGVIAASAHSIAIRSGVIVYGSQLLGDFYGAIYGCAVAATVTCIVSFVAAEKPTESLRQVTFWSGSGERRRISPATWALAIFVLVVLAVFNFIFR
jgi:solute:Na+ symporter, SSS family